MIKLYFEDPCTVFVPVCCGDNLHTALNHLNVLDLNDLTAVWCGRFLYPIDATDLGLPGMTLDKRAKIRAILHEVARQQRECPIEQDSDSDSSLVSLIYHTAFVL